MQIRKYITKMTEIWFINTDRTNLEQIKVCHLIKNYVLAFILNSQSVRLTNTIPFTRNGHVKVKYESVAKWY